MGGGRHLFTWVIAGAAVAGLMGSAAHAAPIRVLKPSADKHVHADERNVSGYVVLTSRQRLSTVSLHLVRPRFEEGQAPTIMVSLHNRTTSRLRVASEPLSIVGREATFTLRTSAVPVPTEKAPASGVTLIGQFSIATTGGDHPAPPSSGVAPRHEIDVGEQQFAGLPLPVLPPDVRRLLVVVTVEGHAHQFDFGLEDGGK